MIILNLISIFLVLLSLSSHIFIICVYSHILSFYYIIIYFYSPAFLSFVKGYRLVAESSVRTGADYD